MYKVTINTDNYKHRACNKKNWELGTINDFMLAINGWSNFEKNIKELTWRIEYFFGGIPYDHHYDKTHEDYNSFWQWYNQDINTIIFHDRLCNLDRTKEIRAYGIAQGYVSSTNILEQVESKGKIRIDFSEAYDIRQGGYKIFKGAYMKIEKVGGEAL